MTISNWLSGNTKKTGKTDLNLFLPASLAFLLLFTCGRVRGQDVTVHGVVYNIYGTTPLEAATVSSTSGRITVTDSSGNYIIVVPQTDSIWFSYLGRSTRRFAVRDINPNNGFYVSLQVDPVVLKAAKVTPRDYRADSLQNRKDYEKYFNYKKPMIHPTPGVTGGGLGVSINIDTLIYMFEFNKIRRAKAFQKRLINDEQEKYVDHRFSRSLVLKVTHLEGDALDSFMVQYRPSYEFCVRATDYDLYEYIKLALGQYQKDRKEEPYSSSG
jgi:hypothetical protein